MSLEYDHSEPNLTSVFYFIMEFIDVASANTLHRPIEMTANRIPMYAERLVEKGSCFDRCWGFLDATCRRICRPNVAQRSFYSGDKKFHCVKFQAIVAPDGLALHVFGPVEGSRHDMTVVHRSGLLPFMAINHPFNLYHVYAEKGYTMTPQLIGLFRGIHWIFTRQAIS
jgi:hypothetical protein